MNEQNFKNHTMYDPKFHFVLVPLLIANLIHRIVVIVRRGFTLDAGGSVLLAVILILMAFMARVYAIKVQDRVIRLEERLRLMTVLPDRLRPRIEELSVDQLIGLRFASDDELPELMERALAGNLKRKAIKSQIKYWRADHWRV